MKKVLAFIFGLLTIVSLITMYGGFIGIPVTIIGFIISLFTSLQVPLWAPVASAGVGILGAAGSFLFAALSAYTLGGE